VNNPPLDFALVCNPERFPLHIQDGTALPLRPAGIQGAPASHVVQLTLSDDWTEPGFVVDLGDVRLAADQPNFIRLFVAIPAHLAGELSLRQIAVLDPALADLRLSR
jgi:hypothetical protein